MQNTGKNYGDSINSQIIQINELLGIARKKGIQMKRIAEIINISPSVLSAFYRTVVPAYIDNKEKMSNEEALEYSFSLVNNISKNRFVPFLPNIILAITKILEDYTEHNADNDKKYFDNFVNTVTNSQSSTQSIEGIYRTYSISSSDFALKCEPMLISKGVTGMLKVVRLSVHSVIQEGFGMIADHQSITIHLNEAKYPKYYPLIMQINIPMCFNPKIYRGIYMALDSSSHPIARRIVAERLSESTKVADFQTEKAEIYAPESVPTELKEYFEYLKERSDVLRVSVIPEPTADVRDLKVEKKILKLYEELD